MLQDTATSKTSNSKLPWHGNASTNPTGGRELSPAHRRAVALADNFAGLPDGMGRYEVIKLLRRVGAASGWNRQLIAHLELLIGYTCEADWAPGGRPIVWLSVRATAIELGIKGRQVRRNEKRMMELRALAFRDSSNHRRFGRRDSDRNVVEAFGVDLSPVAALLPRLAVAEKRQTWEAGEHRRLKRKISAARRRVRAGLVWAHQNGKLDDAAALAVWEEFQSATPRTRPETPLDVLEARLEKLKRIDKRLAALCDDPADGPEPGGGARSGPARSPDVENDCETSDLPPDMSTMADSNVRRGGHGSPPPLDYNTNQSHTEGITVAALPPPGEAGARPPAPTGGTGREGRKESGPRLDISWNDLLAMVPAAMRADLPRRYTSWDDLSAAGLAHGAAIGISRHAWTEACEVMGPRGALLALIVTAARYDHALVLRPGGYLRGITKASRRGELNLGASLHALAKTCIPGKDRSR